MTLTVNIREAKTHWSKLLSRVGVGEEVIIARSGTPIARLVPIIENPRQRVPRSAAGDVIIMPDFDAPLPDEILGSFEK